MKKSRKIPKFPKTVKWYSATNMLTREKYKSAVYGRGAKKYAEDIRDFYNSQKGLSYRFKVVSDTEIMRGRKVKTYTVVPGNKKRGKK